MSADDGPTQLFPEPLHSQYGGIRTKPPTPAYHKAWERIFGKKRPRPKRKRRKGGK